MSKPIRLSIAAGVYRRASEVPTALLDSISAVTLGSFTSSPHAGNVALPATELFDQREMHSVHAKGLPNVGLPIFFKHEMPKLVALFDGRYAKLRLSIVPRQPSELREMKEFLSKENRWQQFDELEVNLACPNHRTESTLHPVLAQNSSAVLDHLREVAGYPGKWTIKIAPLTNSGMLATIVMAAYAAGVGAIVSSKSLLGVGTLGGQKLSLDSAAHSGSVMLETGIQQATTLRAVMSAHTAPMRLIACGGITDAASAKRYQTLGISEGQMATVPYFLEPKAVQRIVEELHFT